MFCSKCGKEINDKAVICLYCGCDANNIKEKSKPKKIIISHKIKEFRRKKHLTQRQFANLFGITAQCVSKWEREECYPDITFLPVLAEAIGCMIDDFFA